MEHILEKSSNLKTISLSKFKVTQHLVNN